MNRWATVIRRLCRLSRQSRPKSVRPKESLLRASHPEFCDGCREVESMRRRKWRLIIVGFVLMILAAGFFLFMLTTAPKSTDPVGLMQTVGAVSGVVGGISLVMIIVGLIGKKA